MKCRRVQKKLAQSVAEGFTLIELLVVMAILGILATGLIIMINPAARIQQANDTQRKNDLAEVQHALQLYYEDYGQYPTSDSNHYICVTNTSGPCTPIQWGNDGWPPYIQKLPKDPGNYSYEYQSTDGTQYQLYAHMEAFKEDPHTCTPNTNTVCSGASSFNCSKNQSDSTVICNYGVSSPNASP